MKLNNNIILPALVIFLIFISSCTKSSAVFKCDEFKNQSEKDQCYSWTALEKQDKSICEGIKTLETKENCYISIAQDSQNPGICVKIQRTNVRDECYKYAAQGKKDPAVCDKIQNKSLIEDCYNFVYSFVAEEKDDISICNKITDWSKGTCYGNIAFIRQNSSFCRVKDQSVQAGCYIVLAGRTNDLSFCDKIENESLVGECYGHLSLYFSSQGAGYDISSCEELKSIISKDSCYLFIAEAKQDANVCENIANQNLKEECQVEVKMINSN